MRSFAVALLSLAHLVQANLSLGGSNGCLTGFCVCTNELECQAGTLSQCLPCDVVNVAGNCNIGIPALCPCDQSDFNSACPTTTGDEAAEDGAGRYRHLMETSTRKLDENDKDDFEALLQDCGNVDYDVSLYVDSHIYAIGTPVNGGNCPFAAAHAVFGNDLVQASKQILLWQNQAHFDAAFDDKEKLFIGTFPYKDLAAAYAQANPNPTASMYDIVTNNCAGFMLSMSSHLGVPVDSHVKSYVAKRLMENASRDFISKIRSSVGSDSLFGGRHLRSSTTSENELVELLVEQNVASWGN